MPTDAREAVAAADAIAAGNAGDWARVHRWPAARVRAGDWTPVQWFDGSLADIAESLESNALLEAAGLRYEVGPDSKRRIPDAYQSCALGEAGAVPTFHSASSRLRRTMHAEAEAWFRPKSGKERLAGRYWAQNSQMLVAMRHNTVSGRLTALWTPQPAIGVQWVPISVRDQDAAKALAAWWNATPVRLMLLNRRGKTLTYPTWQVAHLREIRIPKPDNRAWASLRTAFDRVCNMEMLPMRQAEECAAREVIDDAAARVLRVKPQVVADWRRRLAAEPTITNTRATE